jgi:hypothetical protein
MKNFKKLIKEAHLGNPLNENNKPEDLNEGRSMARFSYDDVNDPALMKARAAQIKRDKMDKEEAEYKAKQAALNKKYGSSFMDKLDAELDLKGELEDLKQEREMIMIDMEEEAEPEGGEIADRYGERLNQIDMRIADIQEELDDLRMYESVNEDRFKKNKDSYIRITEPRFSKDKNAPNFLYGRINYDTGPGVGMALGKETMAGQIRRLSSAEAVRQLEDIGRKLSDNYDLEDLEITDLENGVVELFAVSDDFIDMDVKSELSTAMLNENMGEWPKELTSRYSDEYRFELEKVSPTYKDKPGRAKYRVIDIESGELKGTPVFEKPESLMAYADDLIKPQGGRQSSHFGTNEGTCGYTPDGEPRSKPASPDLNENEIPSYLTNNKAFKKAVEDSINFNDFEEKVKGILGPKYFKLAKTEDPAALKNYYDKFHITKPDLEEASDTDVGGGAKQDNELNLNISNANDIADEEEANSGVVGETKGFDFKKMVKEALTPNNLK